MVVTRVARVDGSFCLLAVDPGDRHCGLAKFRVLPPRTDVNRSETWQARCEWAGEHTPDELVGVFESGVPALAGLQVDDGDSLRPEPIELYVIEEFRLYPWMARQQGYSDFQTPRLIGKLEYLAGKAGRPVYLQGASIKRQAVARAQRYAADALPGATRPELIKLTSGRYDFKGKNQHVRDAIAHGWYWLLTNPASPLAAGGTT